MKRTNYFSPCLPVIITEPGQFKTRSGETVTIDTASDSLFSDCLGSYSNGIPEHWNRSGRIFTGRETQNDIVGRI